MAKRPEGDHPDKADLLVLELDDSGQYQEVTQVYVLADRTGPAD